MNKLVVPGVIGAATAAAGTAGVVKYKKKKHMENEMSKAIMSVLPQDLTEEERITLTKSIMKGAFESIGLDKLAFVTCAGTLLFKDSFSNIVKEAGEEFKNDIKNEVIDAIASISEEILKEAGVEYGFTAYKDTDGSIEKDLKHLRALQLDSIRTGKIHSDEYWALTKSLQDRGITDTELGREIGATIDNKTLSATPHQYYIKGYDEVLRDSGGLKFNMQDLLTEILSDPVTDTRGAEQLNAYLRSTALPFMESGIREKQHNISKLESNVKGLEDSVNNAQFYQVLKKIKGNRELTVKQKELDKLRTKYKFMKFDTDNLSNWNKALEESLARGSNLYRWD